MRRNFAENNGYLKEILAYDAEYLPVTCSHTFAAANLVQGGTPGLHPELCDAKGVIDNAKVLQLCPSWAKPLREGIECIIFRREVEERIPGLPALLSKAGNQSHDVHSKETKVQLMLDLSQLFVSKKAVFGHG